MSRSTSSLPLVLLLLLLLLGNLVLVSSSPHTHPLHPPRIAIQSTTTRSIEIKLEPSVIDDTTNIHGFTINYKSDFGNWENVKVDYDTRTYSLDGLRCGTDYQMYASTYNDYGTGESSEILNTRTEGTKPVVPEFDRFVEVSSSSITLRLAAWHDGGCPLNYFVVEYKAMDQNDWTLVSNQLRPTGNFVIMELTPATWYNLRITAHNNAGSSVAGYECATLTLTGGPAPDRPASSTAPAAPSALPTCNRPSSSSRNSGTAQEAAHSLEVQECILQEVRGIRGDMEAQTAAIQSINETLLKLADALTKKNV